MTEDERTEQGVSRRTMLKRIGAAGAIAWITPVVTSLNTPAFAASIQSHPECVGATCANFVACSSANPDCVCISSDQGGFCMPGSTHCVDLQSCPSGTSAECGPGYVCAVDTCCGEPVCAPISLVDRCPSGDGLKPHAATSRPSSGPGTIGG